MGAHIDHVDIRVSDVDASRRFYETALAPLGMSVMDTAADPNGGEHIGFGSQSGTEFAMHSTTPAPGQDTVTTGAHIAFAAADPGEVQAFYEAALACGGRDIGGPGLRPQYSEGYYGAFVLDPDRWFETLKPSSWGGRPSCGPPHVTVSGVCSSSLTVATGPVPVTLG